MTPAEARRLLASKKRIKPDEGEFLVMLATAKGPAYHPSRAARPRGKAAARRRRKRR